MGYFVITPDTTREDLVSVVNCGNHRIRSQPGRDVHELWCCACGEWIGDTQDTEIAHVSIPLEASCLPERTPDMDGVRCRACEEMLADVLSATPSNDS